MADAQTTWDWLVPTTKDLLRPDEVARYLGRKETFVYELVEEGKLEAFEPCGRQVKRKMITARSVRLVLSEQARSNPAHFAERVLALLPHLDTAAINRLITEATKIKSKKAS